MADMIIEYLDWRCPTSGALRTAPLIGTAAGLESRRGGGGCAALLDHMRRGCPDLVLLDWELPGMPAQDLLSVIRRSCPCLRVVFISRRRACATTALQAGADVFAYKADPPENLLRLIREMVTEQVNSLIAP